MSENGHSYCPNVDNIGHKFPNPFNHHPSSSFIHLPSSIFLHPSFSNHPTLHPWRASTHPRPPPFPGRAPTATTRRSFIKVSSDHQRSGLSLFSAGAPFASSLMFVSCASSLNNIRGGRRASRKNVIRDPVMGLGYQNLTKGGRCP